jgi:hypothetical protein
VRRSRRLDVPSVNRLDTLKLQSRFWLAPIFFHQQISTSGAIPSPRGEEGRAESARPRFQIHMSNSPRFSAHHVGITDTDVTHRPLTK